VGNIFAPLAMHFALFALESLFKAKAAKEKLAKDATKGYPPACRVISFSDSIFIRIIFIRIFSRRALALRML
jgi:hypothetical protein